MTDTHPETLKGKLQSGTVTVKSALPILLDQLWLGRR
jgi:hypothetical protein